VRILIAEDDTASRLILEAVLAGLGHEVVAATDGEQAWQMFRKRWKRLSATRA
jgi:CheY-like chemotaxis protein